MTSLNIHEHACRIVLGHLAPMILHETNNVLTVMAGIRQLLRGVPSIPEQLGKMIDDQVGRVESLMTAWRSMGADEIDHSQATHAELAAHLDKLLQLAGKGRRLTIDSRGDSATTPGEMIEPLLLAALCFLMPMLPKRGSPGTVVLQLDLRKGPDGATLSVSADPTPDDVDQHPDISFIEVLAKQCGSSLHFGCKGTQRSMQLRARSPQ